MFETLPAKRQVLQSFLCNVLVIRQGLSTYQEKGLYLFIFKNIKSDESKSKKGSTSANLVLIIPGAMQLTLMLSLATYMMMMMMMTMKMKTMTMTLVQENFLSMVAF